MAENVFNITELHELIISELPAKNLLRIRFVNSQWKQLVDYTSVARRALFLEPGAAGDTLCKVRRVYAEEDVVKGGTCDVDEVETEYGIGGYIDTAFMDPILARIDQDGAEGVLNKALNLNCNEYAVHPMLTRLEAPGSLIRLLSLEADDSLRRAYLTQPPILAQMITVTCTEGRWAHPVEYVECSSGETLGTLIDKIRKEFEGGQVITQEFCGRVSWTRTLWVEKSDCD
ncbi:hypothetical protein LTR36_007036 [Oleoguttula mirabilis]|uniref:F-box domain-containing protein n=1 Tax=Oleoguttula mirabilis TaxID=1507867 RepID=A0AAV9JBP7_9PEZI|nr:hypothetical protein LTR36_007036 [Oleoguttula mirabilis]